jgi:hypothetical protein
MAPAQPGDYERSDAGGRLVASIALGVAIFLAATPVVLGVVWPLARHPPVTGDERLPPEPRLEIHPRATLADLRAREQTRLAGYGWVDRAHGVTHIPIDRAEALLAQRGLPGWPASGANAR